MTPPIRFLVLVVGGWTIARTVALMGALSADAPPEAEGLVSAQAATAGAPVALPAAISRPIAVQVGVAASPRPIHVPTGIIAGASAAPVRLSTSARSRTAWIETPLPPAPVRNAFAAPALAAAPSGVPPFALPSSPPPRGASRWSGSAWLLARGGDEAAVANNGVLGGSQAGARVLFRVNADVARPLSLSIRVSSPLRRDGVEAAAGVEWQPIARVPVRVLAERRQRVSGTGRSAFALLAHGGVSELSVAAGFRLQAYAQAGVVGTRSRDLFADAGATLVRPLDADRTGGLAAGAGIWGGAQPGASRLDIGPRVTTTFAAGLGRARVSLDWRFRVAGASAPASGPSLTVGTDF